MHQIKITEISYRKEKTKKMFGISDCRMQHCLSKSNRTHWLKLMLQMLLL